MKMSVERKMRTISNVRLAPRLSVTFCAEFESRDVDNEKWETGKKICCTWTPLAVRTKGCTLSFFYMQYTCTCMCVVQKFLEAKLKQCLSFNFFFGIAASVRPQNVRRHEGAIFYRLWIFESPSLGRLNIIFWVPIFFSLLFWSFFCSLLLYAACASG